MPGGRSPPAPSPKPPYDWQCRCSGTYANAIDRPGRWRTTTSTAWGKGRPIGPLPPVPEATAPRCTPQPSHCRLANVANDVRAGFSQKEDMGFVSFRGARGGAATGPQGQCPLRKAAWPSWAPVGAVAARALARRLALASRRVSGNPGARPRPSGGKAAAVSLLQGALEVGAHAPSATHAPIGCATQSKVCVCVVASPPRTYKECVFVRSPSFHTEEDILTKQKDLRPTHEAPNVRHIRRTPTP